MSVLIAAEQEPSRELRAGPAEHKNARGQKQLRGNNMERSSAVLFAAARRLINERGQKLPPSRAASSSAEPARSHRGLLPFVIHVRVILPSHHPSHVHCNECDTITRRTAFASCKTRRNTDLSCFSPFLLWVDARGHDRSSCATMIYNHNIPNSSVSVVTTHGPELIYSSFLFLWVEAREHGIHSVSIVTTHGPELIYSSFLLLWVEAREHERYSCVTMFYNHNIPNSSVSIDYERYSCVTMIYNHNIPNSSVSIKTTHGPELIYSSFLILWVEAREHGIQLCDNVLQSQHSKQLSVDCDDTWT
ncbi:hypothetical protein J6590_022713 [Homalodisca vitripennis]|nr:hypothetical protein J6590_022713 [Homalodisca vitripennis]